jgi:hypothetical protein
MAYERDLSRLVTGSIDAYFGRNTQPKKKTMTTTIINEDMLRRKAPAVFATSPNEERTSDRYTFIPTTSVIETLQEDGWEAWDANQVHSRKWSDMHAKHIVRMRRQKEEERTKVGDSFVELLIVNSHNGLQAYNLHAGIFRMVCSNGLIIGDENYGKVKVKHIGYSPDEVISASQKLVSSTNDLYQTRDNWIKRPLSMQERNSFFADAAALRWESPHQDTINQVGKPRRVQDDKIDLWSSYNVAQENLTRAGWIDTKTRRKARKITSISRDVELNSQLWDLAANYANN